MPPEAKKLLTDIHDAADSVAEFAAGKTLTDFSSDKLLRSGIYYQFAIIGEALAQLRDLDETTAQRISEHWRIIGFRNHIIHGYAKIDDEITWRIIADKLPILQREVDGLLAE
jgi:uncharacterized protein with HEPN domain